ncbi:MAG: 50S ribosomal protein L14 [Patescibacteria group bacterium]
MIQLRSVLVPADNTGAKKLKVIHTKSRFAKIGEVVVCVVDQADSNGAVKDSQIVKALLVRTKKEIKRPDGSYIRFDDNAGVLIDKEGNPLGTRIFGPIAREVKEKGFNKIASLAEELV